MKLETDNACRRRGITLNTISSWDKTGLIQICLQGSN